VQSPTTKWLFRCSFVDTLNGWAAGDSGVIIHTSNGGINWEVQNSGIENFIEDICFLNPRYGWALSNDYLTFGTMVLKTTNGGDNWSMARFPDSTLIITNICFLDSMNMYLGGMSGLILKTTDGGANWIKGSLGGTFFSVFPVRRLSFFNEQYGLACGGVMDLAGTIWLTTDYGYNWTMVDTTPEPLNDVLFYTMQYAFAAGGDFEYGGSFSVSSNGGAVWHDSTLGIFGAGQSVALRTPNEIWIPLGFSQLWMVTTDTGKTWTDVLAPDSSAVYDAVFIDEDHGWGVGAGGAIVKYYARHEIGIQNPGVPVSANLFQNYPNPFNPSTTISFEILKSSKIVITLYDVLGKEIKVLLNEFMNPGQYKINVSSEGLSSGIYFYKLETADFTGTKKMVIIK